MKKFKLLFFALLVATPGFFSSCEKDDSGPTLDFYGGDYIDGNTNAAASSTLNFKISATSTTNMSYMEVEMTGYGVVWNQDIASADNNSYTKEISITAPSNAGTYTYVFTIYDKDDVEIVSKSIVITVVAVKDLTIYDPLTMGGSGSDNGSYLDAETGTVYKLAQLTTEVKALIDVVFDAGQFKNTAAALTSSTGTAFATTTITTAQFDAATTDFIFSGITASANNVTISANSVVLFQTKGGKRGLIKIKTLTSSDVTFALKIQQ